MVIVTALYLAIVYLLFFKLKWIPWNGLTKGLTTVVGVVILTAFLVVLQGLTPSRVKKRIDFEELFHPSTLNLKESFA